MSKTILLIEDDPADARLIQRAFIKAGVAETIFRLKNGEEAIAYLDGESPFDLRAQYPFPSIVVLDLKLPRRSGLEVLDWLRRRSDARRRLPVVMLTSSRHLVDVNRAYDLGVNSYVTKPDTSEELAEFANKFAEYWLRLNEEPELGSTPTI